MDANLYFMGGIHFVFVPRAGRRKVIPVLCIGAVPLQRKEKFGR